MVKYTESQQKAVTYDGGALTLAAAAGSGKTRVIVKRIIEKLKKGEDISRLLVVTFTVDAAAEIRARVEADLNEEIKSMPSLRSQSLKLGKAEICTIDSFCQKTLRRSFEQAGISPDFSISDATSYELLLKRCVTETIDCIANTPSYSPLFDNFLTGRRGDELEEIIISAYNYLIRRPFPKEYQQYCLDLYDAPLTESIWFSKAMKSVSECLEYCIDLYDCFCAAAAEDSVTYKALSPYIEKEIGWFTECLRLIKRKEYAALREYFVNSPFDRLNPNGIKENKHYISFKKLRETVKKLLLKDTDSSVRYFELSEDIYNADTMRSKEIISCLFGAVDDFTQRVSAAMDADSRYYFPQIVRRCFDLLVAGVKDGRVIPTEAASDISKRYSEIMIDEYQDTDSVQDLIFRAVSQNETNIITVGDIKQSIYSFRGAEPEVFVKRLSGNSKKIRLAENFRSTGEVINFVNSVFNSVMRPDTCGIDYIGDESLIKGAETGEKGSVAVSLISLDSSGSNIKSAHIAETECAAKIVHKLIDSGMQIRDKMTGEMRNLRLSDIAILCRTLKNRGEDIVTTLNNAGIQACCNLRTDFFEKYEIRVILAYLSVINNSHDNLSVAASLRSPLFGLTDRELAELRLKYPSIPFWIAVEEESKFNVKLKNFIDYTADFRAVCGELPLASLLNKIFSKLNAEAVFLSMKHGASRAANLIGLIRHAENYDAANAGGLAGYLAYVNELIENKSKEDSSPPVSENDCVRVMTIHGSKGLEFPVCILCSIFNDFNQRDKRIVKFDSQLGVSVKITDSEAGVRRDTLQDSVIRESAEKTPVTEEMRLLYVAMTRARNSLYIIGATDSLEKKVQDAAEMISTSEQVHPWAVMNTKCYAGWLLPVILGFPCSAELRKHFGLPFQDCYNGKTSSLCNLILPENTGSEQFITTVAELPEKIHLIIPAKPATPLPEKVSVSELKALYTDSDSAERLSGDYHFTSRPDFTGIRANGRDMGNAVHKFLRYSDWQKLAENPDNINDEFTRLSERNIFSPAEKHSFIPNALAAFFADEYTQKMIKNYNCIREKRFSMLFKAKEIGLDGENTVIVQGVIDLFAETGEGITLIDYKTDSIADGDDGTELTEKYKIQMTLYSKALERLYCKPITEIKIYSFSLGRYIDI